MVVINDKMFLNQLEFLFVNTITKALIKNFTDFDNAKV